MSEKLSSVPRWEEIAQGIEASIVRGDLTPGTLLPSETQLAENYDVCRMTAHRAMTELQRRGLVVRRRRVGTVVTAPTRPRTNNVAVLCFSISDFPVADYLAGLRAGLSDDYGLLLCDTKENPHREAEALQKMRTQADAIVCFPTAVEANVPLLEEVMAAGIPLLCLDREPLGIKTEVIMSDNYGSSLQAMRALTARGHRRIAHFTDYRPPVSSTQERLKAHRDALLEVGEENPEKLVRYFTSFSGHYPNYEHFLREVHDALFVMMRQEEPPTAIFCLQDVYLSAVLEACSRMDIQVPEQMEIVAFNDCPAQFLPVPAPVLRIVQQPREMGRLAGERLNEILSGGSVEPQVVRMAARIFDPLGGSEE